MSTRRKDIIQPKPWNGEDLQGTWEFTIKIDGVRALWIPKLGMWQSRAQKPLYNIPEPNITEVAWDCECFLGSLKDTIRAVRTQKLKEDTPRIHSSHLFILWPKVDRRLHLCVVVDPPASYIRARLAVVNRAGHEGLVLRQGPVAIKVKPSDTLDLLVTGYEEGDGKHKGRLGFLVTSKGRVGTGFSDAEREAFWAQRDLLIGKTIEVECMQFTPAGVMRHARFIRERFDKEATE